MSQTCHFNKILPIDKFREFDYSLWANAAIYPIVLKFIMYL